MIKKILAATVACSLIATPALAGGRHDHGRGHSEHHKSGGKWVAPLIGGIIIGALIGGSSRERREDPYYDRQPTYPPQDSRDIPTYYNYQYNPDAHAYERGYYTHYCVTSQQVDRWGNVYVTRTCQ